MEFHPLLAKPVSAPQPVGSTAVCINYNSDARLLKSHKIKIFHFNLLPEKEMSADNGFFSLTSAKRALFIYFFSFSSSSWHLLMWVYVSHFYNVIIAMQQSRLEQLAVAERER